jgi:ligand-binding sensor domain-containing protein
MRLKNVFVVFLCLFFSLHEIAQQKKFKNYSQENGLPSNEVYDAFQDKNGCIWFATDRGIAQYNGYEFIKYEPKDGLTDISVFDFFPQEDGTVWCATFSNKLFYFTNGQSNFRSYKHNTVFAEYLKQKKYSTFFLKSLATNSKGELFLSNDDVLLKIDKKGLLSESNGRSFDKNGNVVLNKEARFIQTKKINSKQQVNFLSAKPSSFLQPYSKAMHRGIVNISNENKLVITDVYVFLHKNKKLFRTISFKNHEPLEAGIYDNKHFWVGYRGKGVKVFDYEGNLKDAFLEGHSPSKVFKDCFGGLWVTTIDAGVFYLSSNQAETFIFDSSGVNSLTSDSFGNLYIGTIKGDIYEKKKKNDFQRLHKGLINTPAHVQFFEKGNEVYFYTDNKTFTSKGFQKNIFRGVLKISDDNPEALVFCQYGIYTLYDNYKIISDTLNFRIHDISFVNDKFYLGSIDGLQIFGKNKIYKKNAPLLNCRIDDLDYNAATGLFYIATLGKGVLVYNAKDGKIFSINKKNGLSNNLVTEIYIEDKNTIWACTNHGLNRIQFTGNGNYEIDYITTSNGLLGNQIKDVEIINKDIYIGTTKGLTVFSKTEFENNFANRKHFLRLKSLAVNDEVKEDFLDNLRLKYDENQIDFFVEAVSFSDNKELLYRYKLDGLDDTWRYTKERKISYEFLPAGNYKLIVQIIEGGRSLSKEKLNFCFVVGLPFWKTWWFILLVLIAITSLIFLFFKIKVLTYNKDIVRELLRIWLRRIKRKEKYYSFKESGKEIRIKTADILYVKSSGNYIDIVTSTKVYTVRAKISQFIDGISDSLEFLRIHRSYIIRIDKVNQKTKKSVFVNDVEIPVGEKYIEELDKIVF